MWLHSDTGFTGKAGHKVNSLSLFSSSQNAQSAPQPLLMATIMLGLDSFFFFFGITKACGYEHI